MNCHVAFPVKHHARGQSVVESQPVAGMDAVSSTLLDRAIALLIRPNTCALGERPRQTNSSASGRWHRLRKGRRHDLWASVIAALEMVFTRRQGDCKERL